MVTGFPFADNSEEHVAALFKVNTLCTPAINAASDLRPWKRSQCDAI